MLYLHDVTSFFQEQMQNIICLSCFKAYKKKQSESPQGQSDDKRKCVNHSAKMEMPDSHRNPYLINNVKDFWFKSIKF